MPLAPFYTRFGDLAWKEMRSIFVLGDPDLPDGVYGFMEFYCNEVDCDCRRVLIQVITPDSIGKVLATIVYGWESVEFYQRTFRDRESAKECKGPSLDPINPQTRHSAALLDMFKLALRDSEYADRLKRHYEMFKNAIREENIRARRRRRKRRRR